MLNGRDIKSGAFKMGENANWLLASALVKSASLNINRDLMGSFFPENRAAFGIGAN